jgi:Aminotransferase class-V
VHRAVRGECNVGRMWLRWDEVGQAARLSMDDPLPERFANLEQPSFSVRPSVTGEMSVARCKAPRVAVSPCTMLYFDHNATHPLSGTAQRAWLEAVEQFPANPSSPHRMGQRAEAALQRARGRLARILDCGADQLVFTSGATESANAVLAKFEDVLASEIEHPCVLEPLRGHRDSIGEGRSSWR